jgi:hypothetical protein
MNLLQARPLPPLPSASCRSLSLQVCRWSSLQTGAGGGGRGAESYDRKKVWPSINLNTFWSYLSLEVEVDECKNKGEQDKGEKSSAQAAENVDNCQCQ